MLLKRLRPKHSIQSRLALVIFAVCGLFASASISTHIWISYQHKIQFINENVDLQASFALPTLHEAINNNNIGRISSLLEDIQRIPFVSYAVLYGQGEAIAQAGNTDPKASKIKVYPLVQQHKPHMEIQVFTNTKALKKESYDDAFAFLIVYIFEALFIAGLLIFVINRAFTGKVQELVHHVDKINLVKIGKLALPRHLTGRKDEIGQIASSIQSLHSRVRVELTGKKLSERTLKHHKSILAEEVAARNEELDWQSRSNRFLADISLWFIKLHKTDLDDKVCQLFPDIAELLGVEQLAWLNLSNGSASHRAQWPHTDSNTSKIDILGVDTINRWLASNNSVVIPDVSAMPDDQWAEKKLLTSLGISSIAAFSLTDGNRTIGLLTASSLSSKFDWSANKTLLLSRFSNALSEITIRERDHSAMTELQEELICANEQLQVQAETDELTRLMNRRPFQRQLNAKIYNAIEDDSALTVMMIDIDHFKSYNDIYGHLQGDKALAYVAKSLAQVAHRWDATIARFGGEEFAFLLGNSSNETARQIAWELCQSIRDLSISHRGNRSSGIITISIGVLTTSPEEHVQPNQLLDTADQYLYRAKKAGRNRAEFKELAIHNNDVMEPDSSLENIL